VISGTGLSTTTDVSFGATSAAFTIGSDTQITATVPDTATTGAIAVSTNEGSAVSDAPFVVEPNIVLVLTDDQRYDDLGNMPNVQSELADKGVTFDRAFVSNPLCCPSRASILTGDYSHTTMVYGNIPPYGGFQTFTQLGDDASTIATWLHTDGANYRTALMGKYLNGYSTDDAAYVPPGWNRWVAWAPAAAGGEGKGGYFNYPVSLDGRVRNYGSAPADYSTDVYAGFAKTFIRRTAPGRPLFLYFATRAPHGPSTPAPRYQDACAGLTIPPYPDRSETDVSDKPAYIQAQRLRTGGDIVYQKHCQSLLAVDDAVKTIVDQLRASGRLADTMIVFMSDNGILLGEHHWFGKKVPYEESIRVPMIVRYDPVTGGAPATDSHLVLNVDLAPTFAEVAHVSAPGAEGTSLLPLLDGSSTSWRSDFLIEHRDPSNHVEVPAYCGVRNEHDVYVEYDTGEEELYDLDTDPYELDNLAGDPSYAALQASLHQRMLELCSPPPPGFTP